MNRRKRYVLLFDAPKINTNPEDVEMYVGYKATFYCEASGYRNEYSWEEMAPGGAWTDSQKPGAKTPLLKVIAIKKLDGYKYRCKVTNGGDVFYSKSAELTVVEVENGGIAGKL